MNTISPGELIIFDYSGTLSLEAPRFARPESLRRALTESGLAGLGVTSTEIFWEQIVNPTWIEGSTTPVGYKRVMAERIAALRLSPGASTEQIEAAASRFVESYLDHSRIDPRWRPLLKHLSEHPELGVIIATDHYAEATGKIIDNLEAWNIPARKVRVVPTASSENVVSIQLSPEYPTAGGIGHAFPSRDGAADATPPYPHPILIVNSADIGFWKEESRFWKILKTRLSPNKITRLLVIDDFGCNEEAGDRYGGDPAKIAGRQEKTRTSLREVFQVEAEIIPFIIEGEKRYHDGEYTRLIAETALRIDRILKSRGETR